MIATRNKTVSDYGKMGLKRFLNNWLLVQSGHLFVTGLVQSHLLNQLSCLNKVNFKCQITYDLAHISSNVQSPSSFLTD